MPQSKNSDWFFNKINGNGCSFCRERGYAWRNHSLKSDDGKIICNNAYNYYYLEAKMSKKFSANSHTFVYYQSKQLKCTKG